MKRYKSIVDEKVLGNFLENRGRTLANHVSNSYDIETAIGFASLYCPEIVEVEGCIFIAEFYHGIDGVKEMYSSRNGIEIRKGIEMFVNSWSLGELLLYNNKINSDLLDYYYIDEFANAIKYFWELRMRDLFPDRNIMVEIGEAIMGENGLSVVVYQEQESWNREADEKRYKSVIDEKILQSFSAIRGRTMINHVYNSYDIEMAIGIASLFCPEIIEVEGCIFIAEFYNDNIEDLKKRHTNRKDIERIVNRKPLQELLVRNGTLGFDLNYITEFAKAIKYFWGLRMKKLFPDHNVVVEIGDMGPKGTYVAVYQE